MRIRAVVVVSLILLGGCGDKDSAKQVADLQAQVESLTARVKQLENEQLAADKKAIQHEQVIQVMNSRLKDMETYIGKLQYGQSR